MSRTRRFTSLLALITAGLISGSALAVAPGEAVDLKATGFVSPCSTSTATNPAETEGVNADANCDEMSGGLYAGASLSELVETAADASASAAVVYEFTVDGDMDTAGNMVSGGLGYGMHWLGDNQAANGGAYLVNLMLTVENISDPNSPVEMASVVVHELNSEDCTDPCDPNGTDEGSSQEMLALGLVRGDSYRVTASLATLGVAPSSTEAATAVADYISESNGAWLDMLQLQVGVDLEALAAQVAANTEAIEMLQEAMEALQMQVDDNTGAIEMNTMAIADLQMAVDALEQALADLADVVANHTHTYLTGRGVGHNNTVAETSPPATDEPDESDEVTVDVRPGNGRGRNKNFQR